MTDSRHLGKIEKSTYLGSGSTERRGAKFGTVTQFGPLDLSDR